MSKKLVNMLSMFIFNKNKRQAFRERCFRYKANLDSLDALQGKLAQIEMLPATLAQVEALQAKIAEQGAMLSQQGRYILDQGGVLFSERKRHLMQTLLHEKALGEEQVQSENALYRNLDDEAKFRLNVIMERRRRCAREDVISFDELYAEGDDKRQWRALLEFEQQVLPCGDHYAYKHYKLPIDCFEPEVFLYKHGIDKLKTFKSLGDRAILDVGCFVGDTLLTLRELVANDIYSFEPDPTNYAHALRTLELNKDMLSRGGKIVLENIALGDAEGKNKIFTPLYNGNYIGAASMLIGEHADAGTEVSVRTLDSYVAEHNIKVGMIKVDIEGHEQRFLAGALETIKTHKPILLISIYHNRNDFYQIKPFIESLNLGYSFDFFQGVSRWVVNDIMLACEVR